MAQGDNVIVVHRGNLVQEVNRAADDLNITGSSQWTELTQAEYDGLISPDADTLYVIVG